MNDLYARVLRQIVVDHGQSVCDDPRRCRALLHDYLGSHPGRHDAAVNVLVGALEQGVARDLATAPAGLPFAVHLHRPAGRLQEDLALTPGAARWAVATWGAALGLYPLEEAARHELASGVPAAGPVSPAPPAGAPPESAPGRDTELLRDPPPATQPVPELTSTAAVLGPVAPIRPEPVPRAASPKAKPATGSTSTAGETPAGKFACGLFGLALVFCSLELMPGWGIFHLAWSPWAFYAIMGASGAFAGFAMAVSHRVPGLVGGLVGGLGSLYAVALALADARSIHSGVLFLVALVGCLPGYAVFFVLMFLQDIAFPRSDHAAPADPPR
jgi:hypothetical protein